MSISGKEAIDRFLRKAGARPLAVGWGSPSRRGQYRYLTLSVREATELAVNGTWQLPDFQRGFVWKPSQVCALADSLWHGYPIGPLLVWFRHCSEKNSYGMNGGFIADGLHRLTSLCFLFGRMPSWLKPSQDVTRRFAVYFDVEAENGPRFVSSHLQKSRPGLIPLESVLELKPEHNCYQDRVRQFSSELRERGCCQGMELETIAGRLHKVVEMGERELLVTALYYDRDQVIEIFQRLNSRGMKFRRLLLKFVMHRISS